MKQFILDMGLIFGFCFVVKMHNVIQENAKNAECKIPLREKILESKINL